MKNLEKTKSKTSFGTLYHHRMENKSGSVRVTHRPYTKIEQLQRLTGAGITSVAMALYIYSYGPVTSQEVRSAEPQQELQVQTVSAAEQTPTPIAGTPTTKEFKLSIPFLKTTATVLENVDAANEESYKEALSEGVAHAKGTGLPGQGKRVFLFAHSTNSPLNISKFNAIFYGLNNIPVGEKVAIVKDGKTFSYEVKEKKIVSANDTSWLEPKDGEELILQTCYPPGTTWRRLLVIATPV